MINDTQVIGEIAGRQPATVEVFEEFGIQYCCHGEDTVESACAAMGLDPELVQRELNRAAKAGSVVPSRWADPILESLIGHLRSNTHVLLHHNLPHIQKLARAVGTCRTHRHSQAREVARLARSLTREISSHVAQESEMLFPAIQNIEQAYAGEGVLRTVPALVRHSIAQMERSHEAIGNLLLTLRRLTGDYAPGDSVCASYRALCMDLKHLDRELRLEVHLENNVLYDRARQLSRSLSA